MSSIMEAGGRAPWADYPLPEWFLDQVRRVCWQAAQDEEDLARLNEECRRIAASATPEEWQRLINYLAIEVAVNMCKAEAMRVHRLATNGGEE